MKNPSVLVVLLHFPPFFFLIVCFLTHFFTSNTPKTKKKMYQFTGQGQDLLAQARQLHTDSNDFRAKRRYEKAIQALEQAYKLRRTALISPHAVLTATVDCLAHLYQEMGNSERWHHYAKMVVEEKVAMLGELHVETQSSLDNLHDACVALGDWEGAADARRRNWHARTSTCGIKDETGTLAGSETTSSLIGDIERMLEHINQLNQKIRKSGETEHDIETRLKISQGPISTQAAVDAAQQATVALMHCDFNDRRPIKRDPELAQLLADRMTPADYLIQFGQPPENRWRRGSQIWRSEDGSPATPPNEESSAIRTAAGGTKRPPKIPGSSVRGGADDDDDATAPAAVGSNEEAEQKEEEVQAERAAAAAEEEGNRGESATEAVVVGDEGTAADENVEAPPPPTDE